MRKSSGFQFSLTASVLDTPKGAVRTIEIRDHEIMMGDTEPSDSWIMSFNENALDTNVEQLSEFCMFILNEIKQSKYKNNKLNNKK